MVSANCFISEYWGKAQPHETVGPLWHPVAYHSLDVAAAGEAILAARPLLLRTITQHAGFSEAACRGWLGLSLALHDLGKFADCFQCLVPEQWVVANRAEWEAKRHAPLPVPHGVAGAILWNEYVRKAIADALHWDGETLVAFEEWLTPVFGHHGKPITDSGIIRAKDIATIKAVSNAKEYAVSAAALMFADAKPVDSDLIQESGMRTA